MTNDFESFPKIARLSREIVITEKIDGTNAQIYIHKNDDCDNAGYVSDHLVMKIGSRTRWLSFEEDNHGFYKWALANQEELFKLGEGRHFGEWWGSGVQRGYGLKNGEKRFSLFNTHRWSDDATRPKCCGVVPVLYQGMFDMEAVEFWMGRLQRYGSCAAPRFMKPEGIVIYHTASKQLFKKTIEKDEEPKGKLRVTDKEN